MQATAADAAVRSVTEEARRSQIVDAAIRTIAEIGYGKASYSQIARRAGLSSTGLISYHFSGKDELMAEVVAAVVRAGQAFMQPRIVAAAPGRARLREYIVSNIDFLAERPLHTAAVVDIITSTSRESDTASDPYMPRHRAGLTQLEGYLREGQAADEFRDFDVSVMADAIRAAVDAVARRLPHDTDFDASAYGRELATLFACATDRFPQ